MIRTVGGKAFQSTLSVRRATRPIESMTSAVIFQSTLSVRRATLFVEFRPVRFVISIHALREESDLHVGGAEGDIMLFQSTLSVRRATNCGEVAERTALFQSTLSVRRATAERGIQHVALVISIHALREESDSPMSCTCCHIAFQSTLSVRRATVAHYALREIGSISIHALREESDPTTPTTLLTINNFNPRSP